jgi:hypothetical protein
MAKKGERDGKTNNKRKDRDRKETRRKEETEIERERSTRATCENTQGTRSCRSASWEGRQLTLCIRMQSNVGAGDGVVLRSWVSPPLHWLRVGGVWTTEQVAQTGEHTRSGGVEWRGGV